MGSWNTSLVGMLLIAGSLAFNAEAQGKKKSVPGAPAPVAAPATAPVPTARPADDKVDISDLENKYWAPKDTDFSVVQNRTYSKTHAFFLTPQWGRPINDAYSEGNYVGGTANYFWSERYGVQATYLSADLENNDSTNDLANFGGGVQPDHGKITGYYGVGFNIVPFYAKMSFWGKRIIYFDMAFTPTVGMTQYDQVMEGGNSGKSAFTYGLDVTQYFFFTKWFAIRADLKNQFHTQEVVKYRNSMGMLKGDKVSDKSMHDTLFLIGATFYW
mgnify:FL=1